MIRPVRRLQSSGRALTLVLCASLLAATGCKKDTPPATETKADSKTSAVSEKKAGKRPVNKDEGVEVPTEEDFEEEVEKQITSASDLGKELDLLEKQIQGQ